MVGRGVKAGSCRLVSDGIGRLERTEIACEPEETRGGISAVKRQRRLNRNRRRPSNLKKLVLHPFGPLLSSRIPLHASLLASGLRLRSTTSKGGCRERDYQAEGQTDTSAFIRYLLRLRGRK